MSLSFIILFPILPLMAVLLLFNNSLNCRVRAPLAFNLRPAFKWNWQIIFKIACDSGSWVEQLSWYLLLTGSEPHIYSPRNQSRDSVKVEKWSKLEKKNKKKGWILDNWHVLRGPTMNKYWKVCWNRKKYGERWGGEGRKDIQNDHYGWDKWQSRSKAIEE